MLKSNRRVEVKVGKKQEGKNVKKLVEYTIKSDSECNLSHEWMLSAEELEIDRMYVVSGKTKVEAT